MTWPDTRFTTGVVVSTGATVKLIIKNDTNIVLQNSHFTFSGLIISKLTILCSLNTAIYYQIVPFYVPLRTQNWRKDRWSNLNLATVWREVETWWKCVHEKFAKMLFFLHFRFNSCYLGGSCIHYPDFCPHWFVESLMEGALDTI